MKLNLIVRDSYGKTEHTETLHRGLTPAEGEYAVRHLTANPQTLKGRTCVYELEADFSDRDATGTSWRPLEKGQRWVNANTGIGATVIQADNWNPNDRVIFRIDGGRYENYTNAGFRVHYPKLAQQRRPYVNEYWRLIEHPDTSAQIIKCWEMRTRPDEEPRWFVEYAHDRGLTQGMRTTSPLDQFFLKYEPRSLSWERRGLPVPGPEQMGSVIRFDLDERKATSKATSSPPTFHVETKLLRLGQAPQVQVYLRELTMDEARSNQNAICADYHQQGWTLHNSALINPEVYPGFRYQRRSTICTMKCCEDLYDVVEVTIESDDDD